MAVPLFFTQLTNSHYLGETARGYSFIFCNRITNNGKNSRKVVLCIDKDSSLRLLTTTEALRNLYPSPSKTATTTPMTVFRAPSRSCSMVRKFLFNICLGLKSPVPSRTVAATAHLPCLRFVLSFSRGRQQRRSINVATIAIERHLMLAADSWPRRFPIMEKCNAIRVSFAPSMGWDGGCFRVESCHVSTPLHILYRLEDNRIGCREAG